jgi:hypothetical protein
MEQLDRSLSLTAAPEGAVEGEVINQNVYGAVRALAEQGVSKKGIARQLGLDVKTVRTWLRRPWRVQTRSRRGRQLDVWREFLQARAPEVGKTSRMLSGESVRWIIVTLLIALEAWIKNEQHWLAPGIENVAARATRASKPKPAGSSSGDVRYFNEEDRARAEEIANWLRRSGTPSVTTLVSKLKAPHGQIEVLFPKR